MRSYRAITSSNQGAGPISSGVKGAELAAGEGRGRIYVVEPMGDFED